MSTTTGYFQSLAVRPLGPEVERYPNVNQEKNRQMRAVGSAQLPMHGLPWGKGDNIPVTVRTFDGNYDALQQNKMDDVVVIQDGQEYVASRSGLFTDHFTDGPRSIKKIEWLDYSGVGIVRRASDIIFVDDEINSHRELEQYERRAKWVAGVAVALGLGVLSAMKVKVFAAFAAATVVGCFVASWFEYDGHEEGFNIYFDSLDELSF